MNDAWQSAWVEVLPDFKNFKQNAGKELGSTLGAAGSFGGKAFSEKFASATNVKAAAEKAAKTLRDGIAASESAVIAATRKQADAVGALRVAEARLQEVRENAKSTSAQRVAAEENVSRKTRDLESSVNALRNSESKLESQSKQLIQANANVADSTKRLDGTFEGFGGRLKGLAAPVLGLIATLGLARVAGEALGAGIRYSLDAVGLASDLGETRAAIGTVFGDASADILAFAETANKSLGQTRQAALSGAQTFGIFAKAAGLSGKPLAKFSTDLVGLAGDLASFNNTSPEEAIEALGAGLRGEAEPLRKYGILLDDATLKARAAKMGIYEGNDALTAQQKILASQAEIFAQTSLAQGDFARTSDGLANQQRILQASFEDTQAQLGEALLPAFTELTTYANNNVIPALDGFIDKVGPLLGEAMTEATPQIEALAAKLTPLVDEFARAAAEEGIPGFIQGMNDAADAAPEWIQAFNDINNGFTDLENGFYEAQQAVSDYFAPARQAVLDFGVTYEEFVAGLGLNGETIRSSLEAIDFGATFANWGEFVRVGADELAADFRAAGGQAVRGFINGLGDTLGIKNAAKTMAEVAITAAKVALGIKSPSRVFAQLGVYTAEGFAQGIDGSRGLVASSVNSMVAIPDVASIAVSGSLAAGSNVSAGASAESGPLVAQYITGVPNQSLEELAVISRNDLNESLRSVGV